MKSYLKLLPVVILPFFVGIIMPVQKPAVIENNADFNPDHLDGAFTGGFGEQTCHSCHFDYDLNMEGGSLTAEGIPETYQPGKEYQITVTVESEQLEIGGFQMTSRFEDGSQAGKFDWEEDRLTFTLSVTDEIQYIQHSRDGTEPTGEREVAWTFSWQAPDEESEKVIFNIAANAGNYDDSSFGDWIYVKEISAGFD